MLTTTPKICNETASVKKGSLSGKRQPYWPIIIKIISGYLYKWIVGSNQMPEVISMIIDPQREFYSANRTEIWVQRE